MANGTSYMIKSITLDNGIEMDTYLAGKDDDFIDLPEKHLF